VTDRTPTLAGRLLGAAGVEAVYGRPLDRLPVVPVDDGELAALLACAHRRVTGAPAVAHLGDGLLVAPPVRAGAAPRAAGDDPPVVGDDPDAAVGALARLVAGEVAAVRLAVDPGAPGAGVAVPRPAPPDRWPEVPDAVVERLRAAAAPVVLAGPGVVDEGAVAGLHALAAAGSLGVLNTWGAKGVFHWRSRHHLATVGLQAEDFARGGLADADLVVATGLDPAEAPGERWRGLAPVVEVPPAALDPLAERWGRAPAPIALPPLREGLAAVTQEGWAATAAPIPPSLATLHHARVLAGGGLLAADAGVAGYWVARTFGTTELGAVQVPSLRTPGLAAACALVARLARPARPVLAVIDGPVDGATRAVVELGVSLGVAVPLEVWSPDGPALGPEEHERRLAEAVAAPVPVEVGLAVDGRQLARMVEVAGPVVAWGGVPGGGG